MSRPMAQNDTVDAFLDAAERLLISVGYAGITARRLAEEAGANHGLIHYYFGSMEQLFVQVLERFTNRLIVRQKALYAAEIPFLEKWRTAMGYLVSQDYSSGYEKVWMELQALAWNHPELQERVASVREQWHEVLTDAFTRAMTDYGLDTELYPVEAMVTLAITFNLGIELERLGGVSQGHAEMLDMIDRWLVRLEAAKATRAGKAAKAEQADGRRESDESALS
jgi:AcrR family transcriptional regulator